MERRQESRFGELPQSSGVSILGQSTYQNLGLNRTLYRSESNLLLETASIALPEVQIRIAKFTRIAWRSSYEYYI